MESLQLANIMVLLAQPILGKSRSANKIPILLNTLMILNTLAKEKFFLIRLLLEKDKVLLFLGRNSILISADGKIIKNMGLDVKSLPLLKAYNNFKVFFRMIRKKDKESIHSQIKTTSKVNGVMITLFLVFIIVLVTQSKSFA